MKLDIVIPTRNRVEKLQNCLNSIFVSIQKFYEIPREHKINIKVFFTEEEERLYFDSMFKHIEEISLIKMGEYRVPDFWNGYLKTMTSDALCYITDDVLFVEDTVESIIEEMISRFSTYDGIIGIEQYNLPSSQALQSAFGVIGTKYADRFPDRKVWCENYSRFFCDKELWLYANEIGKFHFSDKARLAHLHPAFTGEKPDYTHKQVRKHLSKDKETFRQRQEKNLLWGRDFTLLNM